MRSRSRPETAALLAAGLLLAACERSPPAHRSAAGLPATRAAPVRPAAARLLRPVPGDLDAVTLKGGEERAYLLDLAAGWYAGLVVDQQGIDVEVRLRAPDGKIVAAIDSLNGMIGPEPLPVVAKTGGRFRLEIRSSPGAPAGRYVLRLDALRPATARDRARVEAERVLAAGVGLYSKNTSTSLYAALARGQEAHARFRTLGLRDRQAAALFLLAESYEGLAKRGGRSERETATAFYQRSLALFGALGDEAMAGVTLTHLGKLERDGGRLEAALAFYRKALSLDRRSHNSPEEALALNNIGLDAADLGRSEEALSAYAQALTLWRALGNRSGEGDTLGNLGRLEASLGQMSRALGHLGQAVALQEALKDRPGLSVALDSEGVALALAGHSRDEVLGAFQRALRLQHEIGERSKEAVTLDDLGWYYHRQGEIHQAERIFRETLAIFQAIPYPAGEVGALINLGKTDLDLGRLAQAEDSFTRALALLAGLHEPADEVTALFGLALVRRAAGRTSEALTAIEGASARVEALRRRPASLEMRQTFFASQQDIYELRVDLLMARHRRDPRAGYDARALMASEEARARTLLDLLARMDVRPAGSGTLLTSREIQRQVVEKGTLLLEYFLGEERSFLWAVTPDSLESFELPPRKVLEENARSVAFLLAHSSHTLARAQTGLALADLSHRLLGPVAHRLRSADRLVIVPDGLLSAVSFAALPDPAGGAPLVVGHEIVNLPSASVLPRLRAAAAGRRPAAGMVALLGDPVFDLLDSRVAPDPAVSKETSGLRGGERMRFARLPFSRVEAQAILSVAPPRGTFVALDFDASREMVLSGRLDGYRIVHFATHTVLNTENPELSGVVLSMVDARGHPRDGFLRLDEIYKLRLSADLVVLSACRTALGREIRGEGLVGLTRGFFSAGARQVVVSLWPVEDRATAELMRRFYGEMLGRGHSPAAALRAAQTSMWRDQGWRSAYYWAGFILQGDWRASPIRPSPPGADL